MTELEELLLAAKAAGIEVEPCTCRDPKWPLRIKGQSGTRAHWNPCINDGDAFKPVSYTHLTLPTILLV